MSFKKLRSLIDNKPCVILNGAMGTELQRRGYKTKLPLWSAQANLDAWDLVKDIHKDYFLAGSDLTITNTFRTTPRTFSKVGRKEQAYEATKQAIEAAFSAQKIITDRPTFIGGSIAPLEDCYKPDKVPSNQELQDEHGTLVKWLTEEGVDFIILETVNALREAKVMVEAVKKTGHPYIISFVVDSKGVLLDGTPLLKAIQETADAQRIAIAINCRPIDVIDNAFNTLVHTYKEYIGLYPNGFGHPHDDLGWKFEENEDSIEKFVRIARQWNSSGVKIIGGCCGTTPDYIRALSQSFQQKELSVA